MHVIVILQIAQALFGDYGSDLFFYKLVWKNGVKTRGPPEAHGDAQKTGDMFAFGGGRKRRDKVREGFREGSTLGLTQTGSRLWSNNIHRWKGEKLHGGETGMRNIQGVANVKRRGKDTGRLKAERGSMRCSTSVKHTPRAVDFLFCLCVLCSWESIAELFLYIFFYFGAAQARGLCSKQQLGSG